MFDVRFQIFGRRANGEVVRLFAWTRDEASGIARAKSEAARFGQEYVEFFAEAV